VNKRLAGWFAASLLLMGADVSGEWSGSVPGRDGQMRALSFTFRQAGEKLEGFMRGPNGAQVALANGVVQGDEIRFQVAVPLGERVVTQQYSGRVSGSEIALKVQREGRDRAAEVIVRRSN
jgi:hypothetical protein